MNQQFVAYYRVSTQRQGQSGLGLEAQRASVENFARNQGVITAEFVEIESGKKNDRPKLREAMDLANSTGATLLIAKLDRLARNAGFIFALRDAGVKFIAADMPEANTLTIGVMAAFAQHERETISQRTKAALAARKARGLSLGNPANLTAEARAKGPQARREAALADVGNRQTRELAGLYRAQGHSLRAIAKRLNASGYTTPEKRQFQAETVRRLLAVNTV